MKTSIIILYVIVAILATVIFMQWRKIVSIQKSSEAINTDSQTVSGETLLKGLQNKMKEMKIDLTFAQQ